MSNLNRIVIVSALLLTACGGLEPGEMFEVGRLDQAFTSPKGTLANMTFDGQAVVDCGDARQQVFTQLHFTVGHLNGDNSVGRIDSVEISGLKTSARADGACLATYSASIPVGWGKYVSYVPRTYELKLPRDMTLKGRTAFFKTYGSTCTDWTSSSSVGNYWYYYRPAASVCKLASADIVQITARLAVADEDGSGTYPELHKIWEDGELNAVVIFGMYGEGHRPDLDPIVITYGLFNSKLKMLGLDGTSLASTPSSIPSTPGLKHPRISWRGTAADGRKITIHTLMINSPRAHDPAFDSTFKQLSPKADIIIYNGHSGFGANIRALARKAQFTKGHYVLVSMMGCDTFAYIDGDMARRVSALNPDDPKGTKYLDMITNLTPGKTSWLHTSSLALLRGVVNPSRPRTYDAILSQFEPDHRAAVTGDEDNAYRPGMSIGPFNGGSSASGSGSGWAVLKRSGTVARGEEAHVAAGELPAGRYNFTLTGTGDADLYLSVGEPASISRYDCRPLRYGSNEHCVVTLDRPAEVHLMVRGWASNSTFQLTGAGEGKADRVALPDGPPRELAVEMGCSAAGAAPGHQSLLLSLILLGLTVLKRRQRWKEEERDGNEKGSWA